MKHVFSTVTELRDIEEDFLKLGVVDGKHLYISVDYLDNHLKQRGQYVSKNLLLSELKNSDHGLLTTLDMWLGIGRSDILEMTVDEVEDFLQLYEMRDSEDLFLNLGEKEEGEEKSIGEIIFLNSLADLIYRGRV